MNISFGKTFSLLQHEADLMEGCLSVGLTALRSATISDKRDFYSGVFNLTIAFERLMKLIVVVNHLIKNDFKAPTKNELKNYGHDLISLYKTSIRIANRLELPSTGASEINSIQKEILESLSKFSKFSRYYNLDSLSLASVDSDPLKEWELIINRLLQEEVPENKLTKALEAARLIHNEISDITIVVKQDLDGNSLSLLEVLNIQERYSLAAPYYMVNIFDILLPLLQVLSELGNIGFYKKSLDGGGPYVPLFNETLVNFMPINKAEIRRKKRWP